MTTRLCLPANRNLAAIRLPSGDRLGPSIAGGAANTSIGTASGNGAALASVGMKANGATKRRMTISTGAVDTVADNAKTGEVVAPPASFLPNHDGNHTAP